MNSLRGYQKRCIEYIESHERCALFVEMGLGKTRICLDAIAKNGWKTLVVAPAQVCSVWVEEIRKWKYGLSHYIVRKATISQLQHKRDVTIISRDSLGLLLGTMLPRFQLLVLDEFSSFKNHTTERFKALIKIRKSIPRIVGLTGTPVANGYFGLFGMMGILDEGQRLGKTLKEFTDRYYTPASMNGHIVYKYKLKPFMGEVIMKSISDICLSLEAKDYVDLPAIEYKDIILDLSTNQRKRYNELEKSRVLSEIDYFTAKNAADLINKLLQLSTGFIYHDETYATWFNLEKILHLRYLIEINEGKNIIVATNYRAERDKIMEEFEELSPVVYKGEADAEAWNKGEIRLLIIPVRSGGYGLNLQFGGHIIVWLSPTWNLELYEQFNARLHRVGQTFPVVVFRLLTAKTADMIVKKALEDKSDVQTKFLNYFNEKYE